MPAASDILMPMNVAVVFAQDKWHRGNLTLNLGVRYDLENTPIKPTPSIRSSRSGGHAVDKNNIAPRLGFTWKPAASATSVVRGGYGRFYDKVVLITTAPFLTRRLQHVVHGGVSRPRGRPGSGRGRLPTDPLLVNGPVVNRAAINALFPPGSIGRNTGTVYIDNPDRIVPNRTR